MFQGQLQLHNHPRTVEPSLREKIVKKVGIKFFFILKSTYCVKI